jgi:hypothetical protein
LTEVREREKVMRGLKRADTPILRGCQIFHNYIRPHESVDGKTPADTCGIEVQVTNKWLTIIQNAASHPTKVDSSERRRQSIQTRQNRLR